MDPFVRQNLKSGHYARQGPKWGSAKFNLKIVCTQNLPPPSKLVRYIFAPPKNPQPFFFPPPPRLGVNTFTCKFT